MRNGVLRAANWLALAGGLLTGALVVACFDGGVTLGAACESSAQCGDGQSCDNGVCGKCGDEKRQVGEVCFGPATERALNGVPIAMAVVSDPRFDEELVLIASTEDCGSCETAIGPSCFYVSTVQADEGQAMVVPLACGVGEIGQVTSGDFDGDGALDLAVTLPQLDAVRVVFGGLGGDGGEFDIQFPGTTPDTLYAADLDGDGADDLVIGPSLESSQEVDIVLSGGDGTFADAVSYASDIGGVRVAPPIDTDGDGVLDLVLTGVADDFTSFIAVLRGDGNGGFGPPALNRLAVAALPYGTAVGDLDDDGNLDLVVTLLTSAEGRLAVVHGNGAGGFEDPQIHETGLGPLHVQLRDINGDGRLDALVANAEDDKLSFYLNDLEGDGRLARQQQLDVSLAPTAIAAIHLDDDGAEDLVVTNLTGSVSVSFSNH